MTITISSDEPSTIDRILQTLQPLRREKLFFDIKMDTSDDEDAFKTAAIRERLHLKNMLLMKRRQQWTTKTVKTQPYLNPCFTMMKMD